MARRLTHNLQFSITQEMWEALQEKAERLHVRWIDIARMAIAWELDREPYTGPIAGSLPPECGKVESAVYPALDVVFPKIGG